MLQWAPSTAELLASLQVALLGVTDGVQASVLVQSLGTVRFVVNVMGDFLQILEVRPEKEREHRESADLLNLV